MDTFLGIVIEQSLSDPGAIAEFDLRGRRRIGSWDFLLVATSEENVSDHLRQLQSAMRDDAPWYAHYFHDDGLIVVFEDRQFPVRTDPATWAPAIEHGLAHGIPKEQLDFKPRAEADARTFFNIPEEVSLS